LITSRNEELAKSSLLVLSAVSDAPESLKVLGDAEGIPALLNLLDSYDDQVKEAAAKIIADLSQHSKSFVSLLVPLPLVPHFSSCSSSSLFTNMLHL
jgi:HEAT repeat protein